MPEFNYTGFNYSNTAAVKKRLQDIKNRYNAADKREKEARAMLNRAIKIMEIAKKQRNILAKRGGGTRKLKRQSRSRRMAA